METLTKPIIYDSITLIVLLTNSHILKTDTFFLSFPSKDPDMNMTLIVKNTWDTLQKNPNISEIIPETARISFKKILSLTLKKSGKDFLEKPATLQRLIEAEKIFLDENFMFTVCGVDEISSTKEKLEKVVQRIRRLELLSKAKDLDFFLENQEEIIKSVYRHCDPEVVEYCNSNLTVRGVLLKHPTVITHFFTK